jgi:hypothetical protein
MALTAMLFIRPPRQEVDKPIFFDRSIVNSELTTRYPRELEMAGIGGAVLVHVDIDEYGRVIRANARRPKILGFIPRLKPPVYNPKNGELLKRLDWADHAELLKIAEEASLLARFVAGARGGHIVAWGGYPVICYFAAARAFGPQGFNLTTGLLNT